MATSHTLPITPRFHVFTPSFVYSTLSYISHLLTRDINITWDPLLLGYYSVCDIFENNPTSPDISCRNRLEYLLLSNAGCLLIWDVFLRSPAAGAACWSNDLIRFALITALLVTIYSSIRGSRRAGEGVIESGNVSLSSCQERCCIVLMHLAEVHASKPSGGSKWISWYQRVPVRILIQIF